MIVGGSFNPISAEVINCFWKELVIVVCFLQNQSLAVINTLPNPSNYLLIAFLMIMTGNLKHPLIMIYPYCHQCIAFLWASALEYPSLSLIFAMALVVNVSLFLFWHQEKFFYLHALWFFFELYLFCLQRLFLERIRAWFQFMCKALEAFLR